MPVADHIRRLGFRRWHARQLIEAHASLVPAFLGVIVVAVCLDQLHWRDAGVKPLLMLALASAGVVLCFKTVTFYFKVLFRAEHYAAQAVCGGCKAYGVIDVLAPLPPAAVAAAASVEQEWLQVRCRKCRHEWTMTAAQAANPLQKSG